MKSVAQLDPQVSANLVELLRAAQIFPEVKIATTEGGLEVADVLVADELFDQACDIAERWEAAETEKKSVRKCDQCGSKHLETIPHDTLEVVLRCQNCGNLMPV